MFHYAGFPIIVLPFMFVMMAGMGLMMWLMMKMMMGMGGHETHGPQRPEEHDTAGEMGSLHDEIASLRRELESMRTGFAGEDDAGSVPSKDPDPKG